MAEDSDHKQRVASGYDTEADVYDDRVRKNMLSHLTILLRDVPIPDSPTVLDVGCGTGISTFEVMNRAHGEGRFIGIDLSEQMVEKARVKTAEGGHTGVEFHQGDAERLEFPDATFDLVISNSVLHWVPNKRQVLTEMHRVLKPNGRIALFFVGKSYGQEFASLLDHAVRHLGIAQRYPQVQRSIEHVNSFISLEETIRLFDEAGFVDTNIYALHRIRFLDPQQMVRNPNVGWWKASLSPDVREAMEKAMLDEAIRQSTAKGFLHTAYHIIAHGRKPET